MSAHQDQGPGHKHVPSYVVWIMGFGAAVLSVLVLYTLWAFWPTGTTGNSQHVSYFGLHRTVSREHLFFLVVAMAGGLGGLIHTIRSFSWYVGNRGLRWSWLPFNLLLPFVGALGGTVFYLVLRAGLFSPSTSAAQASPFGFAAVAVLVGLFSNEAMQKLQQVAENLFAGAPKGADHVPEQPVTGP